ncbi:MAG: prepilin-type N-terminal cleavage/methylation domain-containing protein [Elusimicrobia bacterium]|nr:prepilin-type N-terminal cleavage/methylation domain-containing protein [Elusimicrobiota bacterium]
MNSYLPRRTRGCKGFTLVEVVIAALLLAIGVTASFSVCLMSKFKLSKDKYRSQMQLYSRLLMDDLKSYVTPDPNITTDGAPGGAWRYNVGGTPKDLCGEWALSENCRHDVSTILPSTLYDAPVSARITYTVTPETVDGMSRRRVDITMTWNDPG